MTHSSRAAMLQITEMAEGISNLVAFPHEEDAIIIMDQDDDRIMLDRDGARALGEFLIEWSIPKEDGK